MGKAGTFMEWGKYTWLVVLAVAVQSRAVEQHSSRCEAKPEEGGFPSTTIASVRGMRCALPLGLEGQPEMVKFHASSLPH